MSPPVAAVVGIGHSSFYRHGEAPDDEFVLCVEAILAACTDAGVPPRSIDGFAGYSDDRNTAIRLSNALGIDELRWATMHWGGGGGGAAGAVQHAAAAIATGAAECVVVHRALAQGQFGRYGQRTTPRRWSEHYVPHGHRSPVHYFALNANRFFHETGIDPDVQRSIALASYAHAQNNPAALMRGRPLDEATYDASRWIVEPFHLFDCCQESDGAAALIVVSAERAADLCESPAYILGAAHGAGRRGGGVIEGVFDSTTLATGEMSTVARRVYAAANLQPADVDLVQGYENFAAGVVMGLLEHGLCNAENAATILTVDNLTAPAGQLPLNTAGGNLAEAYLHGMGHHIEAVRQLRGASPNQVPGADVVLVFAGPMVVPTGSVIYGGAGTW